MVEDGVADEEHGWFECYEIQRTVDADISPEAAALLCTWREVYGGFGDFQLSEGDDILVFGTGPVGLSFLKFGRLLGLGYIGSVDPLSNKRQKAAAMGADETFRPGDDLKAVVEKRGKPFDAVIDAVGSPAITNAALPLIKMGGTIGIYGVIVDEAITVEKGKGPYNFNLFVHQWPTRHRERAAQRPLCEWDWPWLTSIPACLTQDERNAICVLRNASRPVTMRLSSSALEPSSIRSVNPSREADFWHPSCCRKSASGVVFARRVATR